jgi:hypothetical protein
MRQSLPDQAHAEAAAHDQVPVMCDRFQMSPEFIHCAALPFFSLHYTINPFRLQRRKILKAY